MLSRNTELAPDIVPVLQGSYLGKAADIALGIAIPVHSHVAINSVLSDYVPKSVRGKALAHETFL